MPSLRSIALGALVAGLLILPIKPAQAAETCPPLRWITLGTAGGPVPTPERAEPANLIIAGDQRILVDTGDGTVNQLAKIGMDLSSINTVFLSHHHMDHTGGLAAVIGLRWMNNMPGVLTIYGPPGTKEMVDGVLQTMRPQSRIGFGLGAAPPTPESSVRVVEIGDKATVTLGPLTVTTAANSHFDHDGADHSTGPISLSYRFTIDGRSITYTGDTGPSAAVTQLAMGTDMLVSEIIDLDPILASIRQRRKDMPDAMYNDMRTHLSTHHITALDLGLMASEAGVGHLVLTHFAIPPGPMEQSEPALRSGIRANYRGPLDLARDLSSYDVGCKD